VDLVGVVKAIVPFRLLGSRYVYSPLEMHIVSLAERELFFVVYSPWKLRDEVKKAVLGVSSMVPFQD
jgi:hypothetical protein